MLPDVLDPPVVHHAVPISLVRHDWQGHRVQAYPWRAYQHALGRVFPWLPKYVPVSLDDPIRRLPHVAPGCLQSPRAVCIQLIKMRLHVVKHLLSGPS